MRRTSVIARISALSLVALSLACGRDETDRSVTIENIGGVTYVKNPKQGPWDSGGASRLRLVRDLQIGKLTGEDEFLFVYISDVAVDGEGDIYVGDRQLNEVRKYDREGRHLRTIGRKGQGPGEFQSIRTVSVNPLNELVVFDNMAGRISVFSDRGEHKETTKKLLAGSWIEPCEIFPETTAISCSARRTGARTCSMFSTQVGMKPIPISDTRRPATRNSKNNRWDFIRVTVASGKTETFSTRNTTMTIKCAFTRIGS